MASHEQARRHNEEALRRLDEPATWPEIKNSWFEYHPRSYLRLCPTSAQVGSMLDRDSRFTIVARVVLRGQGCNDRHSQYNLWGLTEWLSRPEFQAQG